MIYNKKLLIDTETVPIVDDCVILEREAPGRAVFMGIAQMPQKGAMVSYQLGLDGTLATWFSGYVEAVQRIDSKQLRVTVRELCGVLSQRWTIALRNTTAKGVLESISDASGLAFRLGSGTWPEEPIAHFINTGTGFAALELLGAHLEIENFLWLSQPDGTVFIGNAEELTPAKKALAIPAKFFTDLSMTGASCPAIPDFRPGRRIKIGDASVVRIDSVTIQGEMMRLKFEGA